MLQALLKNLMLFIYNDLLVNLQHANIQFNFERALPVRFSETKERWRERERERDLKGKEMDSCKVSLYH